MTLQDLGERLARVPSLNLFLVILFLLESGVDRLDPGAGPLELPFDLLVLAYAVAGVAVAMVRGPEPQRQVPAVVGTALRAALVVAAVVLLVQTVTSRRLNPVTDWEGNVALLLVLVLGLDSARLGGRAATLLGGRPLELLDRYSAVLGLLALVLSLPVAVYRLAVLP